MGGQSVKVDVMWADNQTKIDLLGFDVLVDELIVALTTQNLHPLTIGVLGTWGSGKSSLLAIAMEELGNESGNFACVDFSPWEFEDVADVKTALMSAVLSKCLEFAPDKEVEGRIERLRARLPRFGRRLGSFAASTAPAMAPLALAAIDPSMAVDLAGAVQGVTQAGSEIAKKALSEDDAATASPLTPVTDVDNLRDFRTELASVLDDLPIDAVVVFIDDLDRCLPPTVVDVFEALRLFLHTPKTAHVVAVSRDIVEAAIDSRYPEFKREDGIGIGHEYLEKMLQLQIRVPELSAVDVETYVNLLLTQNHLGKERFESLVRDLRESRRSLSFPPPYNSGVAASLLGEELTPALVDDLTWGSAICDVASSGLRGNPRRLKRFLNDLTWRMRAAARRDIVLEPAVLAKLMVLDEQAPDDFQQLFDWQHKASGPSPELRLAEGIGRGTRKAPAKTSASPSPAAKAAAKKTAKKAAAMVDAESPKPNASASSEKGVADLNVEAAASQWAARPRIAAWLRLEPALAEVDLHDYFSYFRDRITIGSTASTLDGKLQVLLGRIIQEENAPRRRAAIDDLKELDQNEQNSVLDAALDAASRNPDSNAFRACSEIGGHIDRLGPVVCEAFMAMPHQLLGPGRILPALSQLKGADGWNALVASWKASPTRAVAGFAGTVSGAG